MRQLFVLLLLVFSLSWLTAQYNWSDTIIASGIKPDIALSDQDVFIAFMHEANSGFVKCATIEQSGTTSIATVADGYFYGPLDIATDQSGLPRIIYHDHRPGDLAHAIISNNSWEATLIPDPGHDGWDGSIFIDAMNRSHVVSVDPSTGIEYMLINDDIVEKEIIHTVNTNYKYATDVIFNQDIVHTVYRTDGTDELFYGYKKDGQWVHEKIADRGYFPSMTLDPLGNPMIAYYQLNGMKGAIQTALRQNDQWSQSKIMDMDDVEITFSGARKIVDLEFFDGSYYISVNNRKKLWFGHKNETDWVLNIAVSFENNDRVMGQQVSMALDKEGLPHISYYERSDEVPEGGKVHYLYGKIDSTTNEDVVIQFVSKSTDAEPLSNIAYQLRGEQGNKLGELIDPEMINLSELSNEVKAICPTKSDNPTENLSAIDIVRAQRMVLGLSEHCKQDFIAGDINKSGSVSAADLILELNVILGRSNSFPQGDSWRFYRSETNIEDLNLEEIYQLGCVELDQLTSNNPILEFVGVKLGDIRCEKP